MGQSVQNRPFLGVGFEPLAVSGKSFNAERLHPPPQALADLTMDLAEALPAQSEARQGLLQESHAFGISHSLCPAYIGSSKRAAC